MNTNSLLGALFGFGGGVAGGIGASLSDEQKRQMDRDRLALDQQRADDANRNAEAALSQNLQIHKDTLAATDAGRYTDLVPLVKAGILPESILSGGTTRLQTAATDAAMKQYGEQQKALQAEGQLNTARSAVLNQPARPDVAMPAEGAMYSEAETLPGKAATPKNTMLAALLGQPNADALLKQMYPEDNQKIGHAPPGSAIYDNNGKIIGMVPALPKEPKEQNTNTHIVQTAQGQVAITVDANGREVGRVRVGDLPPHAPKDPAQPTASVTIDALMQQYQALARANPNDPRLKELDARIQAQRQTMLLPGAAPWSVATQTPGAQNPVQPSATERKDVAGLDATINAFTGLAQRAQTPEVAAGLGLKAAPSRFLENNLKIPMLSDAQRTFFADTAIAITDAKKTMIGVAQTNRELAGLAPAVPEPNDPALVQKLQAWATWAQRNRDAINASLSSTNVKVPNASGAPATATPKVIRYDAQGNRIP
jgi:hypothetical protein